MKGPVTTNTHIKYQSLVSCSFLIMSKVKVFAHASDIDTDGRAMTLAPQTFFPAS